MTSVFSMDISGQLLIVGSTMLLPIAAMFLLVFGECCVRDKHDDNLLEV